MFENLQGVNEMNTLEFFCFFFFLGGGGGGGGGEGVAVMSPHDGGTHLEWRVGG